MKFGIFMLKISIIFDFYLFFYRYVKEKKIEDGVGGRGWLSCRFFKFDIVCIWIKKVYVLCLYFIVMKGVINVIGCLF